MVDFATTQGLGVKGTNDWTQYSISFARNSSAATLYFGFLLRGTGKAWVDDLELLVDGAPIAQAPALPQGDALGISITELSGTQISNLALLAEVWGFLKYHQPAVTSGQYEWDGELFHILPAVLQAADRAGAQAAIANWVRNPGPVAKCSPCATLNTRDLYMGPDIDWIRDTSSLGSDLSAQLVTIYNNRPVMSSQFYVSLMPNVQNPAFAHELTYPSVTFPDAGFQLLALFRYWNMVEYFYPNRDIMSDGTQNPREYWTQVLVDSIPRVALAADRTRFQQEMIRFIAKINDTHANLWTSIASRPPMGSCYLPVDVRFVEGSPVVLRCTYGGNSCPASGLEPGDVIEQLDGVSVPDLVAQWTPYYADSNQAARLRDIGNYMTRGLCGPAPVVVERGGATLNLMPARVPSSSILSQSSTHDRPGDTFQMLSPDVAYLKLSSVKVADCATYIQKAAGTKGLVIDIRNYPSEFVVFALGSLLVSEPTAFAQFTYGDVSNPGAFHWREGDVITPQQPHYNGKVVILVDEVTQSQAEYTTMAFRTAPGAVVIGSTTAGADGNVSTVLLPGSMSSYISGIGVFYPDGTPTQRVGIIPDIVVTPTIAGIQAGRDEVLEAAIRLIEGGQASHSRPAKVPPPQGPSRKR